MSADYCRQCLMTLIERAMPAIQALDIPQRAACFDGIHEACESAAPDLALAAKQAAEALRDAESRQLKLQLMLTQETPTQSE